MTREEAIVLFEKQLTAAQVVLDSGFGSNPGENDSLYRRRKEMAEIALTALRPVSREQVEKVWRGEWLHDPETGYEHCDKCSHTISLDDYLNRKPPLFCEMCGDAKTDEAVEMVTERMEKLYEQTSN